MASVEIGKETMSNNQLLTDLRSQILGPTVEDLSGRHLTKAAFAAKMLAETDGQALLDLLEDGEWRICERMGLSDGYIKDGQMFIDVPNWGQLVGHLKIVQSV